jgi:hypothetical protein
MTYFRIAQENDQWNVYNIRKHAVTAAFSTLEEAEMYVEEWTPHLTALDQIANPMCKYFRKRALPIALADYLELD